KGKTRTKSAAPRGAATRRSGAWCRKSSNRFRHTTRFRSCTPKQKLATARQEAAWATPPIAGFQAAARATIPRSREPERPTTKRTIQAEEKSGSASPPTPAPEAKHFYGSLAHRKNNKGHRVIWSSASGD